MQDNLHHQYILHLYLHLLFALEDRNLTYISGVFISNVLDALRILEDKNELLVKDIRRGSINRNLNIDDETRKNLNSYLKANAGRADEIEKEFGYRNMGDGRYIPQSYCRECRSAHCEAGKSCKVKWGYKGLW